MDKRPNSTKTTREKLEKLWALELRLEKAWVKAEENDPEKARKIRAQHGRVMKKIVRLVDSLGESTAA